MVLVEVSDALLSSELAEAFGVLMFDDDLLLLALLDCEPLWLVMRSGVGELASSEAFLSASVGCFEVNVFNSRLEKSSLTVFEDPFTE